MIAYTSVEDVQAGFRPLKDAEKEKVSRLIEEAAEIIDTAAPHADDRKKATNVLGIVGQFDAFRWGVQRSVSAHMIEYGDPDGLGDLQRNNQIALRAEVVYGVGIMDLNAFAKIVKPAG